MQHTTVFKRTNLCMLLAATIAVVSIAACNTQSKHSYLGDAAGIGSAENPHERASYEWMMLRDPATGKIPAHIRERELAFAATLPNAEGGFYSFWCGCNQ